MKYFEEWWTIGENALFSTFNGIIADDRECSDCAISSQPMLLDFIDKIALNVYIKTRNDLTLEVNASDPFLSQKATVDFQTQILIVISSAEIVNVSYSTIFQCYLVTLKKKRCDSKSYSAALVQIKEKEKNGFAFQIIGQKPMPVVINRPKNNNDEY